MPRQFQTNTSANNKLIFDLNENLFVKFPVETPATLYQKGQVVTLLANANVEVAVAADFPLGYVSVANIVDDPNPMYANYVTVACGRDAAYGYAKTAPVATGALVSADGQSSVDAEFMDFITAATGTYACGICISGAAAGEAIKVLYFPAPVLIP